MMAAPVGMKQPQMPMAMRRSAGRALCTMRLGAVTTTKMKPNPSRKRVANRRVGPLAVEPTALAAA